MFDEFDYILEGDTVTVAQGASGIVIDVDGIDQFVRDLLSIKQEYTGQFSDPYEDMGVHEFDPEDYNQSLELVEEMLANARDY